MALFNLLRKKPNLETLTLENIDKVKELGKTDFYKVITDKQCKFRFGSTKIDAWKQNVRLDNMPQVMKAVEKFEKGYGKIGYYKGHIEKIKRAYESKNYEDFQQEVGELLVSINWE